MSIEMYEAEFAPIYPYNLETLVAMDPEEFDAALSEGIEDLWWDVGTAPYDDEIDLNDPDVVAYVDAMSSLLSGRTDNETLETGFRAYAFGHMAASLVTRIPEALPDSGVYFYSEEYTDVRDMLASRATDFLIASPTIRKGLFDHLDDIDPTGAHHELVIYMAGAALHDIEDTLAMQANEETARLIRVAYGCEDPVPVLN
jgi:hypothetical protein